MKHLTQGETGFKYVLQEGMPRKRGSLTGAYSTLTWRTPGFMLVEASVGAWKPPNEVSEGEKLLAYKGVSHFVPSSEAVQS